MGNRANVVFVADGQGFCEISPAIYLHWNGGPESVYAFLAEMDRRQIRTNDTAYEAARFCEIVGEFFSHSDSGGKRKDLYGFSLSLGIMNGPATITRTALAEVQTDPGDNGFYIVDRARKKVRRFTAHWVTNKKTGDGHDVITEMKPADVKAERDAAAKHKNAAAFAELYAKMFPFLTNATNSAAAC